MRRSTPAARTTARRQPAHGADDVPVRDVELALGSESYLDSQSTAGTIDPKSNLSGQKAYLWSGTSDYTVEQKTMNDLNSEYQHYGVVDQVRQHLRRRSRLGVARRRGRLRHDGQPVHDQLQRLRLREDVADLLLRLGERAQHRHARRDADQLRPDAVRRRRERPRHERLPLRAGELRERDSSAGSSSRSTAACRRKPRSARSSSPSPASNKYADTNDLLVLYPYQVSSSTPNNPNGCWDWWGYETTTYALKSGPQMAAIKKMVDRIQSAAARRRRRARRRPAARRPRRPARRRRFPRRRPPPAACYTASNYAHVQAGRAHDGGGYALANGSNQNMGLDNVFYQTTLKKTGTNYYVIGCP